MKRIPNEVFTDNEFIRIKQVKELSGTANWHDYILWLVEMAESRRLNKAKEIIHGVLKP